MSERAAIEKAAARMASKLFALGGRVPAVLEVEAVLCEDFQCVMMYAKVDGDYPDICEGHWLASLIELPTTISIEQFDNRFYEQEFGALLPHSGTTLQ